MNKRLLTPDTEITTDQSNDTIKFQLGEPVSLLLTNGLLVGVWVRGYLQKHSCPRGNYISESPCAGEMAQQ